jgi:Putative prokaryotic signal transducing protein
MYASLADEELLKIAKDADALTEIARQALDDELQRRDVTVEPEQEEQETKPALTPENRKLFTIAQYRDLHEALLAQGTLQSAGIECLIADDNMVRLDWFISNLLGGVKLRVCEEDVETARTLLEQNIPESFEVEGLGEYEQPRCPKCQSMDITFEEFHKGTALTTAFVIAPLRIAQNTWKCHSCGQEWRDTEDKTD